MRGGVAFLACPYHGGLVPNTTKKNVKAWPHTREWGNSADNSTEEPKHNSQASSHWRNNGLPLITSALRMGLYGAKSSTVDGENT